MPTTYDYFGGIGTKDGNGNLVPYYDFNFNNPTDNTPTVWENTEGLVDDDDDLPDLVEHEEEKPKEDKPKEKEDPFKFNLKDWISQGSEKLDRDYLIQKVL